MDAFCFYYNSYGGFQDNDNERGPRTRQNPTGIIHGRHDAKSRENKNAWRTAKKTWQIKVDLIDLSAILICHYENNS